MKKTPWLFPLAFVVHDGEEILTMPAWIDANTATLEQLAATSKIAAVAVQNLPRTTAAVATAVLVELIIILVATMVFTARPERRWNLYLYAALLGVFTVHSLTHLLQAVVFRGYTPGVFSAVVVIPPAGMYIYRYLFSARILDRRTAIYSALAGAVLFLPVLELVHLAGRAAAR